MKQLKKILSILAFLLPLTLLAQTGGGKLDMGDLKTPKIKWTQDEFDFGDIKQNIPVHVSFELQNTGNAPLIISNVEASCGCTGVDYNKAPIMPGQKTQVKVTFDAKTAGRFSKSVTVTTNANPAVTVLKFFGTVK